MFLSMAANDILNQVNDLNKKLSDAQNAQNDSTNAIKKANEDIADTRQSLKQVNGPPNQTITPYYKPAIG